MNFRGPDDTCTELPCPLDCRPAAWRPRQARQAGLSVQGTGRSLQCGEQSPHRGGDCFPGLSVQDRRAVALAMTDIYYFLSAFISASISSLTRIGLVT